MRYCCSPWNDDLQNIKFIDCTAANGEMTYGDSNTLQLTFYKEKTSSMPKTRYLAPLMRCCCILRGEFTFGASNKGCETPLTQYSQDPWGGSQPAPQKQGMFVYGP